MVGVTGLNRSRDAEFGEYARLWLENRDLKPRTRYLYGRLLERFILPTFGQMSSVRAVADDGTRSAFEITDRAGPDVASIVFDIDGIQVSATLEHGYFAAWWPAPTSLIPRWGPPNPNVTITLNDGTRHTQRVQTYDVSPL